MNYIDVRRVESCARRSTTPWWSRAVFSGRFLGLWTNRVAPRGRKSIARGGTPSDVSLQPRRSTDATQAAPANFHRTQSISKRYPRHRRWYRARKTHTPTHARTPALSLSLSLPCFDINVD